MRSIVRLSRQVLTSLALTGMLVLVAMVGCTAALQFSDGGTLVAAPTARPTTSAPTITAPPTPTREPTRGPTVRRTSAPPKKPSTTTSRPKPPPTTGVEVWNLASGGTDVVGSGSKLLIQYRVEVEQATKVTTASFASMVDETLANSRGWTNEGWRFQRVTLPLDQVGMVVRLAIPATVDRICGKAGLSTGGVVSCRTGKYVMINLTRWNNGVTAFAGDVVGYRQLVINHEVGHLLGHGHVSCPGPGLPEPVMMQVYYTGLQGCAKNAWPYAEDGTRIG